MFETKRRMWTRQSLDNAGTQNQKLAYALFMAASAMSKRRQYKFATKQGAQKTHK